jgi:glutathione peroxidase
MSETFFGLSAQTPGGQPLPFESYRGKVVLVVNTATQCGLAPQFEGLEKLHQKFKERELVVVGFPCDQFAHQEPVENADMEDVCKANFGVTFPLTAKIEVNGPGTHPVFHYLKAHSKGFLNEDIKWNFTKFLVARDGATIQRYSPTTEPAQIEGDIETFLKS